MKKRGRFRASWSQELRRATAHQVCPKWDVGVLSLIRRLERALPPYLQWSSEGESGLRVSDLLRGSEIRAPPSVLYFGL